MDLYKTIEYLVNFCYSECPRSIELYDNYAGMNLEEIVKNFIQKAKGFEDLHFFEVKEGNDLVGYFAITNKFDLPMLWTFFTRPKYRKTELLWNEIEKVLTGKFYAGVYSSNIPAKKYLERHGGKLLETEDTKHSFFLFER